MNEVNSLSVIYLIASSLKIKGFTERRVSPKNHKKNGSADESPDRRSTDKPSEVELEILGKK